jgi:ubiquinone/menaquinone biosynthesis C-methylase UbiE
VTAPTPLDYARWRETRLGRITEWLEQRLVLELAGPVAGRAVLDVGAGDGTYAVALAQRGARVCAIDMSSTALAQANRKALVAGVTLETVAADALQLPFPSGRFDLVLAVTALSFVSSPTLTLREMARVLRPGGCLVLGELGARSAWAVWRRACALLGSRTWRGAHFWTPSELRRLASDAGLLPGSVFGAAYYPPCGVAAAALQRFDAVMGRTSTLGAAFLGATATKPL